MVRPPASIAVALSLLLTGCTGLEAPGAGSNGRSSRAPVQLAAPAGPPLPASQSRATVELPFRGGYRRWLTFVEASRTIPLGGRAAVVWLPGLGTANVGCSARPRATFGFTSWAKGEGPPRLRSVSHRIHGVTVATGLLGHPLSLVPPAARHVLGAEARRQTLAQMRFAGGGEAFQFTAHLILVVTPTATRCDVLGEARVLTTGAFRRYAPGGRLY